MTAITLFNPGFETGLNADARSITTSANQNAVTADSTQPHTGTYALKWNPGATYMDLGITPKSAGQVDAHIPSQRGTHTFTIWIKTNLVQGAHTLTVSVTTYDGAGTELQTDSYTPDATVPVTTDWQQFTISQDPVDNTVFVQPKVELTLTEDLNNASFYFDDMALDFVKPAPPSQVMDIGNLRLDVEVPPTELANLILNPSGESGTWGWTTAQPNSLVTSTNGNVLTFTTNVTQGASVYSNYMNVAAGQTVAGRLDLTGISLNTQIGVQYEWADISHTKIGGVTLQKVVTSPDTIYTYVEVAPAGAVYVRLRLTLQAAGGGTPSAGAFMIWRQAMVTTVTGQSDLTTTRINLATNPNFATDITGWGQKKVNVANLYYTANVYHNTAGSLGMLVNKKGWAEVLSDYIPIVGGQDYTFQGMVRTNAVDARTVGMILVWDKGVDYITESTRLTSDVTGAWSLAWVTATAPSNATNVQLVFYVKNSLAGERYYLDEVMLEQSSDLGAYFDGDTPDTTTIDYSWKGTANASVSTAVTTNQTFDYSPPTVWQNILGPAHEIKIEREALNVGTLNATILDPMLDPATADTLKPGKKVRVYTQDPDHTIYTGVLTSADVAYDLKDTKNPVKITLTASDNIATLANTKQSAVVQTVPELAYVLEPVDVPWNLNGSGDQIATANVVARNKDANAVDVVSITRDIVHGYAWVDRHNVLQVWSPDAISSAVLGILDEAVYSDLDVSFSTDDCINQVNITWMRFTTGNEQSTGIVYGPYRNTESVAEWGLHAATFTISGTNEIPADIEAYAQDVLTTNATPKVRINSVQVPIFNPDWQKHLLDLYDLVQVSNTLRNLDNTARVTGITHSITPDKWMVTYTFSDPDNVATPQQVPDIATSIYGAADPWHTVGAANEPNFWHGATASSTSPVQFTKGSDGYVSIRGNVLSCSDSQELFVLPVGYRPDQELHFLCIGAAWDLVGVIVTTDGTITINGQAETSGQTVSNVWLSACPQFKGS